MSSSTTPHTNSARLANYIGRDVRLWVKVMKIQGETAIVQASDGGQVKVMLLGKSIMSDLFIEVVGKVVQADCVKMLGSTDLGSDFTDEDLKNYDRMVEASENPKFRHLFQPPDA